MNAQYVLVRLVVFGYGRRPYEVMPVELWEGACAKKPSLVDTWEEVAHGTEEELRALAKLMPERILMSDN